MSDPDGRGEPERLAPESLNRRSVVGLIASVTLALVGLFVLPSLRSLGLSFMEAFWTTIGLELVALVGIVVSVLTLYGDRTDG